MTDRGFRNNNPGNIRRSLDTTWKGQSALQNDSEFVQFDDPVYGIRAIVRIMKSYEREGIDTIADAISKWAPPNENDTASYISAVCDQCSISSSEIISLDSVMPQLVRAIIIHENGSNPYTDAQIAQGVSLA